MEEMAAIMNYTIQETVPNNRFKYLIKIAKMLEFDTVRKWMSQTYGLAEQADRDTIDNKHWGFEIRLGGCTVYLKGDEELSWFKMKFGPEAALA